MYPTVAMKHCMTGFNILMSCVEKEINNVRFIEENKLSGSPFLPANIYQVFANAHVRLPVDAMSTLLDDKLLVTCQIISAQHATDSNTPGANSPHLLSNALNLALMNLRSHLRSTKVVSEGERKGVYEKLNVILHQTHMLWQHKKQEEVEEEREKEAFYKFKSRVHCEVREIVFSLSQKKLVKNNTKQQKIVALH